MDGNNSTDLQSKTGRIFLAENLRYLRKSHHLTQQQAGSLLGVTKDAISKWETGKRSPDILATQKLADFYQVDLKAILYTDLEQKEERPS